TAKAIGSAGAEPIGEAESEAGESNIMNGMGGVAGEDEKAIEDGNFDGSGDEIIGGVGDAVERMDGTIEIPGAGGAKEFAGIFQAGSEEAVWPGGVIFIVVNDAIPAGGRDGDQAIMDGGDGEALLRPGAGWGDDFHIGNIAK